MHSTIRNVWRIEVAKTTTALAIAFATLLPFATASGAVVLATAPQGTTNGGTSILATQLLGARFTLEQDYHITSLGGHFKGYADTDRSLFLAVVALSDAFALPSLSSLSTPLFATTFVAPSNDAGPYPFQVADTLLATSLDLSTGSYGLIVGSGMFGATGTGWMPVSGPIQSLPWFFAMNAFISNDFRNLDEQPIRFLVNGNATAVPEPSAASLVVLALLAALLAIRSARPRRLRSGAFTPA